MSGPVCKEEVFEGVLDTANVAKTARAAKRIWLGSMSRSMISLVWSSFTNQIKAQLDAGKGVNVAKLGKFAPNLADKNRLTFVLCDNFCRSYKVSMLKKPVRFGTVVDINYVKVSIETGAPKDEVRNLLSEIVDQIGNAMRSNKRSVMIDFGRVGTLYADHRRVQFAFQGVRRERGSQDSAPPSFARIPLESSRDLCLTGNKASAPVQAVIQEEDQGEEQVGAKNEDDKEKGKEKGKERSVSDEGDSQLPVPRLKLPSAAGSSPSGKKDSGRISENSNASSSQGSEAGSRLLFKTRNGAPVVYPIFLDRDPRNALRSYDAIHDEKLNQRSIPIDINTDIAFERMQEELGKSLDMFKNEDLDIQKRNKMSQMAYMQRQLQAKEETLATNEFLMQQARERRAREQKERVALRGTGAIIADTGGAGPFPVEKDRDLVGAARTKRELQRALQSQMRSKERKKRQLRANAIAEERFLMDCNIKLMQADRRATAVKKEQARRALQSQWQRQTQLAQMQKLVTEAKNGRILVHSQSEDGLLTVRSVRQ